MDVISTIRSADGSGNIALLMAMWASIRGGGARVPDHIREQLDAYMIPCVVPVPWYATSDMSRVLSIHKMDMFDHEDTVDHDDMRTRMISERPFDGCVATTIYAKDNLFDLYDRLILTVRSMSWGGERNLPELIQKIRSVMHNQGISDAYESGDDDSILGSIKSYISKNLRYVTPNVSNVLMFSSKTSGTLVNVDVLMDIEGGMFRVYHQGRENAGYANVFSVDEKSQVLFRDKHGDSAALALEGDRNNSVINFMNAMRIIGDNIPNRIVCNPMPFDWGTKIKNHHSSSWGSSYDYNKTLCGTQDENFPKILTGGPAIHLLSGWATRGENISFLPDMPLPGLDLNL